jgi:hypothetical protein
MGTEQGAEELAVVGNFQVQQLVNDDFRAEEIDSEGEAAPAGAARPLAAHGAKANLAGGDA